MIQITLTFPSVDAAVKALREIPESALTGTPAPVPVAPVPAAPAPVAPMVEVVAPTPAPVAPAPAAPTVEYADLQKAVFDLVARDRDAAARCVKQMGVRTFKDLPADRWAEAKALVDAELATLGD